MDKRGQREISRNYVVDASVVAKWVLPIETYQENAFKLKQDQVSGTVDLLAPTFLTLEVTNALWKAVKLKRLSEEDAQDALKMLGDTKITLYEMDWPQASEVLDIASELDIAIYDAAYVELTEQLSAIGCTGDNNLVKKLGTDFQDKFYFITDFQILVEE